eukprot:SAG31_NODE_8093_length_1524_cov_1.751579_1_plen_111_part_10
MLPTCLHALMWALRPLLRVLSHSQNLLVPNRFGGNLTIFYGQGPIVKSDAFPSNVEKIAFYRSEIHSKHAANTTGEMVNTPAISMLDGYTVAPFGTSAQAPQGQGGGRVVL